MSNTRLRILLCLLTSLSASTAFASEWLTVLRDKGRTIELDTSSVQREADGKVVATGRLVLEKEIVDTRTGEPYKYIQTTARYDCSQRSAATIKRAFIKGSDEVLREEAMQTPTMLPVRTGNMDERILREVCRPPTLRPPASPAKDKASAAAEALRQAREDMLAKQVGDKTAPQPQRTVKVLRYTGGSGTRKNVAPPPAPEPQPSRPATWAYSGEGGPDDWAQVSPDYALCQNGQRQSPIDISDSIQVDLEPIQFDYRAGHFSVLDTSRAIEARIWDSNLTLMGKTYELEHIRFQRPGEETLDGHQYPMSLHLEHRAYDGEILIVSVLMDIGGANPAIQTLLNYLPLEKGMEVEPEEATLNPGLLLPNTRAYHTYMGSLTRPPCTEDVIWIVLQTPIQLSAAQESIFARLYPENARPLQGANGRLIKSSRNLNAPVQKAEASASK